MSEDIVGDLINNLEHVMISFLGQDRKIDQESLADLLRLHGRSLIVRMAMAAALTKSDASYRLEIVENTSKHPGGVPKLGSVISRIDRADEVRKFVEGEQDHGGGTEAAVAAARAHFGMSRSSIFECIKISRWMEDSPDGDIDPVDRITH